MRNFILGTDWWSDCDDSVALRLLCPKAKEGEIGLLGVVINGCMEYSVASMDGMLCLEGMSDIPVGIDRSGTDFEGLEMATYQKRLSRYAVNRPDNNDAEESGENRFIKYSRGLHKFVIKNREDDFYKKMINDIIA